MNVQPFTHGTPAEMNAMLPLVTRHLAVEESDASMGGPYRLPLCGRGSRLTGNVARVTCPDCLNHLAAEQHDNQ